MEPYHIWSHMFNSRRTALLTMNFLQRRHLIQRVSRNINPFGHNLPVILTINANKLEIAAEPDRDRFRTMYEYDTGHTNISAAIKRADFELVAAVESTPRDGTMAPFEVTTTTTMPRSWILQAPPQHVLPTEIFDEKSFLETGF